MSRTDVAAALAAVFFDVGRERPLPVVLDCRCRPKPVVVPVKLWFAVDDGLQVFVLNGDQFGNGGCNTLKKLLSDFAECNRRCLQSRSSRSRPVIMTVASMAPLNYSGPNCSEPHTVRGEGISLAIPGLATCRNPTFQSPFAAFLGGDLIRSDSPLWFPVMGRLVPASEHCFHPTSGVAVGFPQHDNRTNGCRDADIRQILNISSEPQLRRLLKTPSARQGLQITDGHAEAFISGLAKGRS